MEYVKKQTSETVRMRSEMDELRQSVEGNLFELRDAAKEAALGRAALRNLSLKSAVEVEVVRDKVLQLEDMVCTVTEMLEVAIGDYKSVLAESDSGGSGDGSGSGRKNFLCSLEGCDEVTNSEEHCRLCGMIFCEDHHEFVDHACPQIPLKDVVDTAAEIQDALMVPLRGKLEGLLGSPLETTLISMFKSLRKYLLGFSDSTKTKLSADLLPQFYHIAVLTRPYIKREIPSLFSTAKRTGAYVPWYLAMVEKGAVKQASLGLNRGNAMMAVIKVAARQCRIQLPGLGSGGV
jgi:hypothetical protein